MNFPKLIKSTATFAKSTAIFGINCAAFGFNYTKGRVTEIISSPNNIKTLVSSTKKGLELVIIVKNIPYLHVANTILGHSLTVFGLLALPNNVIWWVDLLIKPVKPHRLKSDRIFDIYCQSLNIAPDKKNLTVDEQKIKLAIKSACESSYWRQKDFLIVLENKLTAQNIVNLDSAQIVSGVKEEWNRVCIMPSLLEIASKICSTASSILAIVKIFNSSDPLSIIMSCVSMVGSCLSIMESIRKLIMAEEISEGLEAVWDITTGSLNLMAQSIPLFFALNPPVVICLALVANGVSVAALFMKPLAKELRREAWVQNAVTSIKQKIIG